MAVPALDLPIDRHHILKPLLLILLLISCQYLVPESPSSLALVINGSGEFEPWRIITGNFVHSGDLHLLFNCLGVVLVWFLFAEAFDTKRFIAVALLCSLSVGVGVFNFSHYDEYVGFSGALHGMLLFGAVTDIKRKDSFGWIVFIIIAGKIIIENSTNMSIFAGAVIDGNIAVKSHLFGGLAGALLASISKVLPLANKKSSEKSPN